MQPTHICVGGQMMTHEDVPNIHWVDEWWLTNTSLTFVAERNTIISGENVPNIPSEDESRLVTV